MARRSGLGRGLDAILPPDVTSSMEERDEQAASLSGGERSGATDGTPRPSGALIDEIAVDAVRPNPYQPRKQFDAESLDDLALSIESVGLLQPILVRPVPGGYELIAGERRWRAAQQAGLTSIPALIRATDDQAALVEAVVENVQRTDLNAIEEAAAYEQLIADFSLTQEDVAGHVGRSRSAVANTLRLLQLSPGLQRLILDGELTAGHGRALLATPDPMARELLAERAVTEGWSVRELEDAVRKLDQDAGNKERDPEAPGSTKLPALLELEQLLADRLSTRVRVDLGRKRGRIEIEFADLEDLERIFLAIS